MKFTINKKPLAQMLRALTQNTGRKRGERDRHLRLVARAGRITMRANDAEAGCQANVLEEGVCFFRYDQFLPLIRTYSNATNLTIGSKLIVRYLFQEYSRLTKDPLPDFLSDSEVVFKVKIKK